LRKRSFISLRTQRQPNPHCQRSVLWWTTDVSTNFEGTIVMGNVVGADEEPKYWFQKLEKSEYTRRTWKRK
jgi:hypothetical protein